jgi:hypothetical protein
MVQIIVAMKIAILRGYDGDEQKAPQNFITKHIKNDNDSYYTHLVIAK